MYEGGLRIANQANPAQGIEPMDTIGPSHAGHTLAVHASESSSQASEHPRSYCYSSTRMAKFSFECVSLVAALDLSLVPRPSSNISLHCLSGN
ncbi:hypothetical protein PISMIDRAFT_244510 [Pisolithus microcarpus 441]|uniref:Uncharacterized protein n=1 Tax=Pisolithus microcarpus 441 TaxID=765257 RepID=A0A0D0A3R0_9AGAM|nr:hypothetical protein PISMIDRAFT_244510 [Pisolithus microcarpus 441]